LTTERNGFCDEHQAEAREIENRSDALRGSRHQRGYDNAWLKLREKTLRAKPLCEACEDRGFARPATIVHHRDENPRNNSRENLMSLCRDCHEKIHGRLR
jgi:5-methylcytosine-specific restriction protein A